MLRIGIVGAENSHTVAIAKTINIEQRISNAQVVGVWGETPELAKDASERGEIPTIVETPEAFIGQVDGIVTDHRHAKDHLPAVQALLEAGIPLFIDKPFCYRVAEGQTFLKQARALDVPVASYSVLPKQASFRQLQEKIQALGDLYALTTTGPCDIHSEWGGVFFYGIHQVDMIVRLAGYDAVEVRVHPGLGQNHVATVHFKSGLMAGMNLIGAAYPSFHVSAIGEKGRVDETIAYDENMYLSGIEDFVHMFRTGETDETEESMLGPVAFLEALEVSVDKGGSVPVPAIG